MAVWELLFAMSARSGATSLTSAVLARIRVSRLLAMLEMAAASRDPAVDELETASEMLVK